MISPYASSFFSPLLVYNELTVPAYPPLHLLVYFPYPDVRQYVNVWKLRRRPRDNIHEGRNRFREDFSGILIVRHMSYKDYMCTAVFQLKVQMLRTKLVISDKRSVTAIRYQHDKENTRETNMLAYWILNVKSVF